MLRASPSANTALHNVRYICTTNFTIRTRRTDKPTESTAEATQADDKKAWSSSHRGLPELPHHALKLDEQHWRSA
jgi:hypothetical protein